MSVRERLAYLLADRLGVLRGGGPYRMAMRRQGPGVDLIVAGQQATRRLRVRGETSDAQVYLDVFHHRAYETARFAQQAALDAAYRAILAGGGTPLIIDAGANVGAASLWFRDAWPKAAVLAVEPEGGNHAELAQRLAGDPLAHPLRAAVAGTDGDVAVVDAGLDAWGFRTVAAEAGATTVPALTIASLIATARERWPAAVPFIAKIDIEGFETDVFAADTGWIDAFALVIVELHDWMLPGSASARPVIAALAARDRDFLIRGENVFSFRNDRS